jgi:hypothetical protein
MDEKFTSLLGRWTEKKREKFYIARDKGREGQSEAWKCLNSSYVYLECPALNKSEIDTSTIYLQGSTTD